MLYSEQNRSVQKYLNARAGRMASQPSEFVTLVSSDGFEFIVRRESAYVAGTIKKMLDPTSSFAVMLVVKTEAWLTNKLGNFAEAVSGRCVFENMK